MNIEQTTKGLVSLAKELNKYNIRWALGASLLLQLEGYDISVADIDIVIHDDDYQLLLKMLKNYEYTYQEPNEKYKTTHFFSLLSEGIDVDIMIGFKVIKDNFLYVFPFHIEKEITIDNTIIYLSSISEWLTAYKAMNRIDKVLLIQKHHTK